MDPRVLIPLIASGAYVEPAIHPKPGAVTRMRGHRDKGLIEFLVNASLIEAAMLETYDSAAKGCEGAIASGLKAYLDGVRSLGFSSNIALGTLMLLLPVSAALALSGPRRYQDLLSSASGVVKGCSGVEETRAYYKLLSHFRPSHLGRYRGPVPSAYSGGDVGFTEVLKAAGWDLVHSEILEGYPATRDTVSKLLSREGGLEAKALRALLELLADKGDTLIASKFGFSAYKASRMEAKSALWISEREGLVRAVEWLDSLWRARGWNPGAALDILSLSIGLYLYEKVRGAFLGP